MHTGADTGGRVGARRRWAAAAVGVLTGAVLLAACSSSPSTTAAATSSPLNLVGFVTGPATGFNGTIPTATAAQACGSSTHGWLSELESVPINQAKVTKHWGAIIPVDNGVRAKQMEATGTISAISIGSTDVPFDHPFGGDMSYNQILDPPYAKLHQNAGTGTGNPPDVVHDELASGQLPHTVGAVTISPGEQWPTLSAASGQASALAPGFEPKAGDRVADMGSFVIDCGHTDFHSELHNLTFMAYGHRAGTASVVHAFYNPFEVSQEYNPNPALSGAVTDTARFTTPTTKNILGYVVEEILRLAQNKDSQATLPQMLVGNRQAPTPWQVCAPAGTSGSHLSVTYDFSVRPGVTINVVPDAATGCATVTTAFTSAYTPVAPPGQQMCPTPWSWVDKNSFNQGDGGTGSLNVPQLLTQKVQSISPALATAIAPKLQAPLLSVCDPPLTVAGLNPVGTGTTVTTSSSQVLPFAGWVKVAWG